MASRGVDLQLTCAGIAQYSLLDVQVLAPCLDQGVKAVERDKMVAVQRP
jgi:hypothetical protein